MDANAEIVILSAGNTIQATDIKKEIFTETMRKNDMSKDTVEKTKMRMKYYKNAEKREKKRKQDVEILCDSWGSTIEAMEVEKVITIIKAIKNLRIEIAQPDNPENDGTDL